MNGLAGYALSNFGGTIHISRGLTTFLERGVGAEVKIEHETTHQLTFQ